jgi:hypothetical protein
MKRTKANRMRARSQETSPVNRKVVKYQMNNLRRREKISTSVTKRTKKNNPKFDQAILKKRELTLKKVKVKSPSKNFQILTPQTNLVTKSTRV